MNPRKPAILLSAILTAASLTAAPITWGPATDTNGKSQLIEGNVVFAFSGGTGATITGGGAGGSQTYVFVGGNYQDLNFLPAPGNGTSSSINNGAPGTGDSNFDTIIRSLAYSGPAGISSGTQTILGLTNGSDYQIQVFFNDQRTNSSTRVMTFGDGEASPSDVGLSAPGTAGPGNGWGQHAVGTFTADGTSQALTHTTSGFGNVHVNAILIVELGPPPAPDKPTNLTAAAGNEIVILDWDDNTQFGFTNFIVRRSGNMGGPYTEIATPTVSNFADTGRTNGTPYYYVVAAKNSLDQVSDDSDEVSATPDLVPEPPNFLFIIADDQDTFSIDAYRETEPAELVGSSQHYLVDTPNIDRLADEGMLFHQARIMGSWTGAVCTASRTCIMTGLNTWDALAYRSGGSAANTFPGIFNTGARSGMTALPHATYRTCKNGNSFDTANNAFTIRNDATRRGNTDGNGSEWHAGKALEHIEHWRINHRAVGKPFLMYLGFSHPHDERNARNAANPPNLVARYNCSNTTTPGSLALNPAAPPLPVNHLPINEAAGIPANFPFHPFDNGHLDVRDEERAPGILEYRTEAVVRNEIGRNFACVDWIDRQLGRVFDKLEDPDGDGDTSDSVIDNTYIVYTADHGIAIGRHGLQGKQNLYEHTWKVPYIVRGPGIAAGSETDALVYLHDTFPTFCDLAGIDIPATIDSNDGQSFRTVLEGAAPTERDVVYGLYSGGSKPGMRAVTNGRFKLIKYDVDSNATQVTQMFDLENNPFELLDEHGVPNLATHPAYASIRQDLEELLTEQRILNDDPHAFLGDRTLLRFEDGTAGQPAGTLSDRLPFGNDGTAASGNGGALPAFSSDIANSTDFVKGETNTLSLDFEQNDQNYLQVADADSLDFGAAPFTIEAWVKLESLPNGDNAASSMPVVMKKVIGAGDADLDYMFLAAAGAYGNATTYDRLALLLGSTVITSSLAIPDTGWHHISVALDPVTDTVRFTLDDQTDTQATAATGTANAGPLVIGAHFNSSGVIDRSFDGLIDELSITDGFLAPSELQPLQSVTPAAPFRITGNLVAAGGDSFDLTFESDDTRLYHIQCSTTLQPGSWTDIRTHIPGATGMTETTVTGIPLDPAAPQEFFRVSTSNGL